MILILVKKKQASYVVLFVSHSVIGCLQIENFSLPVHIINSPSYNEFIEGIDFFRQVTQTLGRVEKCQLSKSIFYIKNQFLIAENDLFNDIKVGETFLVFDTFHYRHF